jgi:hypothetical protein
LSATTTNPSQRTNGARGALHRGDTVRVRSAAEIAKTLDANHELDGLPFMPEMLAFSGQVLRVQARADKTCDTINLTGCNREMDNTVHLVAARCDGSAHGGCEAGCLLFFKEAWLAPVPAGSVEAAADAPADDGLHQRLTATAQPQPGTYRCQATQLLDATRPLSPGRHYLRDVRTRNVNLVALIQTLLIQLFDRYQAFARHRLPGRLRFRDGEPLPVVRGSLSRTPVENLDLQPGELVEVKSLAEIRATLDRNQRNRGMWYDREMVKFCGKQMRVVRRVNRLLDEKTGTMIEMKTPGIILEGATCTGQYYKQCQRQVYSYFREIWLRRVPDETAPPGPTSA